MKKSSDKSPLIITGSKVLVVIGILTLLTFVWYILKNDVDPITLLLLGGGFVSSLPVLVTLDHENKE
ncbi:hypothetical protein ACVR1I_06150 [Streptococcus cameli]